MLRSLLLCLLLAITPIMADPPMCEDCGGGGGCTTIGFTPVSSYGEMQTCINSAQSPNRIGGLYLAYTSSTCDELRLTVKVADLQFTSSGLSVHVLFNDAAFDFSGWTRRTWADPDCAMFVAENSSPTIGDVSVGVACNPDYMSPHTDDRPVVELRFIKTGVVGNHTFSLGPTGLPGQQDPLLISEDDWPAACAPVDAAPCYFNNLEFCCTTCAQMYYTATVYQ